MRAVLFVSILSVLSLSAVVDCCSCPVFVPRTRSYSLQNGICSGDVFVARVTGATCSCLPTAGEENVTIHCHNYQLLSGSNGITVELLDRGQCYGSQPYAVLIDSVQTCSELADTSGLIIPNQGYTVQEPSNSTFSTLRNLTDSSGHCDLPCDHSDTRYPSYFIEQGCFYTVTITEAIKGNYTVGQTLMVAGPDTLTTCGNPYALLKINEHYVVGVGSVCEPISAWSTLRSYSADELQTLRAFSRDFEAGNLTCMYSTAPEFATTTVEEPQFTSTAVTSNVRDSFFSLSLIISSMALVFMATLFN